MEIAKDATGQVTKLIIARPDDWHRHLRQGGVLRHTVKETLLFGNVLVMPNLKPALTMVPDVLEHRKQILNAVPLGKGQSLRVWSTQYLTDNTSPAQVADAQTSGVILAFKYYPAGATTNSDSGVTSLDRVSPALAAMEKHDVVLSVHGEVMGTDVDIFDRERFFVDRILSRIVRDFPRLRIVLEHITTCEAADFVREASDRVAATITPQHLLYSRNALFTGGIRPHRYCLPVLKREEHRQALVRAAASGNPKFFLGTDSAPHERGTKEAACGCAGCYTTGATALALYAQVFEEAGALDKLEGFAAHFGADFYRVPRSADGVVLRRAPHNVPNWYPFGSNGIVVPLCAGETLQWRVAEV